MNNTSDQSFYSSGFGYVTPTTEQKDIIGILADHTAQEKDYLMVWKNDPGNSYDWAVDGRDTNEVGLKTNLEIEGYLKLQDDVIRPEEPNIEGHTLFATGQLSQSRVHTGNYPVIRAKEDVNSREGYSTKFKNKVAIFCNATGDIMPHTTNEDPDFDPEDPDADDNDSEMQDPEEPEDEGEYPPAEMENPLEIQNPNPNFPALKVCQDLPEPTTIEMCNEQGGGSQINFGQDPVPDGPNMTNTPGSIQSTPDGTLQFVPAGPSGFPVGPVPPVAPAIVIPPVTVIPPIVPVTLAPPPVAIPGGVIAPVVTITPGGGGGGAGGGGGGGLTPSGLGGKMTGGGNEGEEGDGNGGDLTGDGEGGNNGLTFTNPEPDTTTTFTIQGPDGTKYTIKKDDDDETVTHTVDEEEVITLKGGNNPTIEIPVPMVLGDPNGAPGTLTFTGVCDSTLKQEFDCTSRTLKFTLTDINGPKTLMELGENTTFESLDYLDLTPKTTNPGDSTTLWLDNNDKLKFGSDDVAMISDIGGSPGGWITLTDQATNPGNSNTIWKETSGRPKFGTDDLAYLSDISSSTSSYVTLAPQSSNPGGSNTVYANSSNRPLYGSELIATADSMTDGNIPVFKDGKLNEEGGSPAARLLRTLYITSPNNAALLTGYNLCGNRQNNSLINGNNGMRHSVSLIIGGNNQSMRWDIGTDVDDNGGDDFFIRRLTDPRTYALKAAASGAVELPNGLTTPQIVLSGTTSGSGFWNDVTVPATPKLRYGANHVALIDTGPGNLYSSSGGGVKGILLATGGIAFPNTLRLDSDRLKLYNKEILYSGDDITASSITVGSGATGLRMDGGNLKYNDGIIPFYSSGVETWDMYGTALGITTWPVEMKYVKVGKVVTVKMTWISDTITLTGDAGTVRFKAPGGSVIKPSGNGVIPTNTITHMFENPDDGEPMTVYYKLAYKSVPGDIYDFRLMTFPGTSEQVSEGSLNQVFCYQGVVNFTYTCA